MKYSVNYMNLLFTENIGQWKLSDKIAIIVIELYLSMITSCAVAGIYTIMECSEDITGMYCPCLYYIFFIFVICTLDKHVEQTKDNTIHKILYICLLMLHNICINVCCTL
jgi:hypothetical protein